VEDAMTSGRVCFGFEVVSSTKLRTLRPGSGDPLSIEESAEIDVEGRQLAEWLPRPDNPFHGRLIATAAGHAFWTSDAGWYGIPDGEQRIVIPAVSPDELRREIRLWGIPVGLRLIARGDLSVHAAAIEVDGQAVLLAAPGHFGKTTLAAAFAQAGHRLLSEDVTCVRPGRAALVLPGPAIIRLRRDMAPHVQVPGDVVGSDDRLHVVLHEDARGTGAPVPLRLILLLRMGDGAPELQRLPAAQAIRDLWSLNFKLPTDASRAACFSALADLASRVEILDLARPLRVDALGETIRLVERHIGGR
jgi:hypothetical protein